MSIWDRLRDAGDSPQDPSDSPAGQSQPWKPYPLCVPKNLFQVIDVVCGKPRLEGAAIWRVLGSRSKAESFLI